MSKQASRVGVRNDQVDIYGRVNTNLPLIDDLASFLPYHTELNVYKNGTEQLLPVNTSEPTTSPILADIRYPTGVWRNKQYFTYRESPTEATGKARIKSIKGNTLCWNQLVQNGNFASTSGWTVGNGSFTVSSNVATLTKTDSSAGWTNIYKTLTWVSGHKYLTIADVKISKTGLVPRLGNGTSFTGLSANAWHRIATIEEASGTVYYRVGFLNDGGATVDDNCQYKNVQLFDLTTMGLDTLTVDQFKSLFPLSYYAYNSGSLLNFNGTGIKTTGKNLINYINNRTSNGITFAYDPTTGGVSVSGTNTSTAYSDVGIGSADLTKYTIVYQGDYIASIQSDSNKIRIYVELKSLASGEVTTYPNIQTSQSFTVTEPCYMYTRIQAIAGTHDSVVYPMVRYDDTDSSFEPYTSSTLSLPISTYFPTGMKSAGTIYDELSDKAITRVGSVDLGSLNWQMISNGFYADVYPSKANEQNSICSIYTFNPSANATSGATIYNALADKEYAWYSNLNRVYVKDSSYTSGVAFKQAMTDQNVKLNYELATYTEVSTLDLE